MDMASAIAVPVTDSILPYLLAETPPLLTAPPPLLRLPAPPAYPQLAPPEQPLALPAPASIPLLPRDTRIKGEIKRLYAHLARAIMQYRGRVRDDAWHHTGGVTIGTQALHILVCPDPPHGVSVSERFGSTTSGPVERFNVHLSADRLRALVELIARRIASGQTRVEQRVTAENAPPEGEGWLRTASHYDARRDQLTRYTWSRITTGLTRTTTQPDTPIETQLAPLPEPARPLGRRPRKPRHLAEAERFKADLQAEIAALDAPLNAIYHYGGECIITRSNQPVLRVVAGTMGARIEPYLSKRSLQRGQRPEWVKVYAFTARSGEWLRLLTLNQITQHNHISETQPALARGAR
jgi:hypothetical protein